MGTYSTSESSIRFLDIVLSFNALVILSPIFVFLIAIGYCCNKSLFFFQTRVGRNETTFRLVKIRTMVMSAPNVPTHFTNRSDITSIGRILRKLKIDELPQLWNVLKGEMSLVGPRPCLESQHVLLRERRKRRILDMRPGITGRAQILGIDMARPEELAEVEEEMMKNFSVGKYFFYILATVVGLGMGDRIRES